MHLQQTTTLKFTLGKNILITRKKTVPSRNLPNGETFISRAPDIEIHTLRCTLPSLASGIMRESTRATESFTPFQQDAVPSSPQWEIATYLSHNSWQPQPTGHQTGPLTRTLDCLGGSRGWGGCFRNSNNKNAIIIKAMT